MKNSHTIRCSLKSLQGIREFVRDALASCRADSRVAGELVLALDEMCSNLIIHGHRCNPDHVIEISVDTDDPTRVVFEIADESQTFNINQFDIPELNDLIHEKRKGGLGIRLVRTIMDEIEYYDRDGKNICRLVKIIPR